MEVIPADTRVWKVGEPAKLTGLTVRTLHGSGIADAFRAYGKRAPLLHEAGMSHGYNKFFL